MLQSKPKKCRAHGCPNTFRPFRSTDKYCSTKCAIASSKPPTVEVKVQKVYKKLRYKSREPASRTRAKAAARVRDGGVCQLKWKTGDPANHWQRIQVHHILYLSEGGPDEGWNLITLCENCHHNIAHKDKKLQPYLLELVNGKDCFDALIAQHEMTSTLQQKLRWFRDDYDSTTITL